MRDAPVLLCSAIAALIIIKSARDAGMLDAFTDPEDQTGSFLDQVPDFTDLQNYAQDTMNPIQIDQAAANEAAFLAMIRAAEGTSSDEGYRALFGWRPGNGKTFDSYASHPRQFFNYTDNAGKTIRTSAAGAYQITATTFDGLVRNYGYSDFTPGTQDAMALDLIKERGALADVDAGRFETALNKVRRVWASLPGAGVDQPERNLTFVKNAYTQAGGVFA
jgi:lysozyme